MEISAPPRYCRPQPARFERIQTMNRKAMVVAFVLLLAAFPVRAVTLTVTTLANNGPGSLRDTVMASLPGDVIDFAVTGAIPLSSVIVINHTLWIKGPGPRTLAIGGSPATRFFSVARGTPMVSSDGP